MSFLARPTSDKSTEQNRETELLRQPGRPKGSRDSKPRQKRLSKVDAAGADESEPFHNFDPLPSNSRPMIKSTLQNVPHNICMHDVLDISDDKPSEYGQRSMGETEAAWSMIVSMGSADPFHADWPNW